MRKLRHRQPVNCPRGTRVTMGMKLGTGNSRTILCFPANTYATHHFCAPGPWTRDIFCLFRRSVNTRQLPPADKSCRRLPAVQGQGMFAEAALPEGRSLLPSAGHLMELRWRTNSRGRACLLKPEFYQEGRRCRAGVLSFSGAFHVEGRG